MRKKILAVVINALLYRGTAVVAADPWRALYTPYDELLKEVTKYAKSGNLRNDPKCWLEV